ncbi:MAG: HXXEE domain-containing protein [Bacillota bacterium]|nr:HXXEE domain-containing protein [Bacillota bacterium]
MNTTGIALLFILTITIHNIEEGLWLPQWSHTAKNYHKPVDKSEFHFALIVITALAYLISGLFMFHPELTVLKYLFAGYAGTMIINAFIPHLIATIVLKKYAPGLITGIFVNLPLNSLIIDYMIRNKIINLSEAILSSLIFAVLILMSLPLLFRLGRKITDWK